MKIFVLGSGAGGGFPQWNCNCPNCKGLRAGTLPGSARTQSSLAVSDGGDDWLLVNASPDLRAQLETCPTLQPARAVRDTAIAAGLRMGAPEDTLVVTGDGFVADATRFEVFGQTAGQVVGTLEGKYIGR